MNINFKQPKYVLPLILLPFLCLLFLVYQSGFSTKQKPDKSQNGMNMTVGQVSGDIQKKELQDKLEAYRDIYKEGDGLTAVSPLPLEKSSNPAFTSNYSDKEKRMLDSINREMKMRYGSGVTAVTAPAPESREMQEALRGLVNRRQQAPVQQAVVTPDPMQTFRQQMGYLDSMNKANDPEVKAEHGKKEALAKAEAKRAGESRLTVRKADGQASGFNTVMPVKDAGFIKVVIDENVTGYAGSRIRLRLLDDMMAGQYQIPKGSFLYALITGFSGQRVELSVTSILLGDRILPVKLEVYDMDGLAGLYVPESAFRDFTKDLGTNTVQGVTIDGGGTGSAVSQFAMSTASKMSQSTSSAIAGLIRKNKARLKYNSFLYLIDNEALEKAQKTY